MGGGVSIERRASKKNRRGRQSSRMPPPPGGSFLVIGNRASGSCLWLSRGRSDAAGRGAREAAGEGVRAVTALDLEARPVHVRAGFVEERHADHADVAIV